MKNILLLSLFFVSSAAFAQEKSCSLWLGDVYDSTGAIQKTAEQYLGIQTKLLPNEAGVKNIFEMRDDNGLAIIKIWAKPKKAVVNGAMATVYVISSYKISSVAEKIDVLYKALQNKVSPCTTETTGVNTVFGNSKMFIEKTGGDFSKKNLPMATLTVTAK
jgi:hypothetical protein